MHFILKERKQFEGQIMNESILFESKKVYNCCNHKAYKYMASLK